MNHIDLTAKDAKNAKKTLLFKDECYVIQGAVFDVYREMGCGFLEVVYQECMEKALLKRQFPFRAFSAFRGSKGFSG
ncbi:GxxExxY protein [Thiolapillus sp.]|uniref:GxxExxY protein n=1 Tax=Thiolapillus sp. TaxID=2017437 RepID=UPI003AF9675E